MATFAGQPSSSNIVLRLATPAILFNIAAVVILGGCAALMAADLWLDWPSRDLWQHAAALNALISDPHSPGNPFVASAEPSRHYHPDWAAMALLARSFGWSAIQTINVAAFVNAAVLAAGFYLFGRAYFRSDWGPLALIFCCTLGWISPVSHTGFINCETLMEGIAYPAPLLVGLSFVLWAAVIKSFENPWLSALIVPLSAFMFATHQLGAGLGFLVALSIAATWPGRLRERGAVLVAIAAGVMISTRWIYFNPISAVLRAGNPTWRHGVDFYSPSVVAAIFFPSSVGIVGLLSPRYGGRGRPLLIALVICLLAFVAGANGYLIGTRFAPTAALILQVGLAGILVGWLEDPNAYSHRVKLTIPRMAIGIALFQIPMAAMFVFVQSIDARRYGSVLNHAEALSANLPDRRQVAAYDFAAWPVVASGQKVLSVPWPEPFIADLRLRQQENEALFDTRLTREQRLSLAKKFGIRTLILDERFGPRDDPRDWRRGELNLFTSQALRTVRAGPMWRFDLY